VSRTIDVEAERAATPGCAAVNHLNNAGAALPTEATLGTMIDHLRFEAERGGYEAAVAWPTDWPECGAPPPDCSAAGPTR